MDISAQSHHECILTRPHSLRISACRGNILDVRCIFIRNVTSWRGSLCCTCLAHLRRRFWELYRMVVTHPREVAGGDLCRCRNPIVSFADRLCCAINQSARGTSVSIEPRRPFVWSGPNRAIAPPAGRSQSSLPTPGRTVVSVNKRSCHQGLGE